MIVLDRADRRREVCELSRLIGLERIAFSARDAIVRRQFKRDARALGPGAAVVDVMSEALLARIEINRCDALPSLQQRDRDMQRGRRFSRTALLVSENDDVRRLTVS